MATTTLLSLEQFAALPDDGHRHELTEGVLVEMPPPKFRHTWIAENIHEILSRLVRERSLGRVFVEGAYLLAADPPTIRVPDVSFLEASRLQDVRFDDYIQGAPELAIEIVSPSESAEDLDQKVAQYLESNCRSVWVVYPKTRSIFIYRSRTPIVLTPGDSLEEPSLFPGWSVPTASIFE